MKNELFFQNKRGVDLEGREMEVLFGVSLVWAVHWTPHVMSSIDLDLWG